MRTPYYHHREIRKFLAPEIIMGEGTHLLAADYARHFGEGRILIVTDPKVRSLPWFQDILKSLKKNSYDIFSDISPNPRMEEVEKGAELYLSRSCHTILAIGGGSPMDCAKGIGIVSSNRKPIQEFEGVDQVDIPMPPLICIPSTAGTAADLSQFAIITESLKKYKMAIISKSIIPDLSLCDPLPLVTMDPYLTACTGIDALVHAVEAFVSNASSALTDTLALQAISLVVEFLKKSIDNPDNLDYRNAMMTASINAGLAFSNASLGIVHAMAHSLGGLKDLPHGECNALLLPYCMRFNYAFEPDRYKNIAEIMHISLQGNVREQSELLFQGIKEFTASMGISGTIKTRGVNQNDLEQLAQAAVNDACMATNPRAVPLDEMKEFFEVCFG